MEILLSLFPVVLFLTFLFIMDRVKLVSVKLIILSLVWGVISAIIAYLINNETIDIVQFSSSDYSKYVAPILEELIKSLFVVYLVSHKKVGFAIDAAIYGFATGAGFSLAENIYYLNSVSDASILVWIIRGFGTAIMHGGCTSVFSVLLISGRLKERRVFPVFLAALMIAALIHSAFNHFYFDPVIQTLGIIVIFPLFYIVIFRYNINQLGEWLEAEFSSEVELLGMINKGELSSTKAGEYLISVKEQFSNEVIFDMYCYLKLYLELSIKAKSNIMLKENDIEIPYDPELLGKLAELKALRKKIGKVGELVLSPLVKMNYRNLWKINQNTI